MLCGGNIDTSILGRCLERGLAADGRLVAFKVLVSDSPNAIAQLSKLIGEMGVRWVQLLLEDIFSGQFCYWTSISRVDGILTLEHSSIQDKSFQFSVFSDHGAILTSACCSLKFFVFATKSIKKTITMIVKHLF